jgi:hypothetical protein
MKTEDVRNCATEQRITDEAALAKGMSDESKESLEQGAKI